MYNISMKVAATLNFVTHTHERVEFTVRGHVIKTDDEVGFRYTGDDYTVTGRLKGDVLTVTRSGTDGYEMVFESGTARVVALGGIETELHTDKLLAKLSDRRLSISVSYTLGGNPMQMILHADF